MQAKSKIKKSEQETSKWQGQGVRRREEQREGVDQVMVGCNRMSRATESFHEVDCDTFWLRNTWSDI